MAEKKKEDIKKSAQDLEEILLSLEMPEIEEIKKDGKTIPQRNSSAPLDYDRVKLMADAKAEEIVESIVLLYLPVKLVSEHEYVSQKMSIDKINVSDLLFQMKTSEHAIKKLLEDIDSGNMQSRAFEVLSQLQKSKMEIVKHLTVYMVTMENNYKNLKDDYTSNVTEKNTLAISPGEAKEITDTAFKSRGTKDIMNMIKQGIEKRESFEDAEDAG